jgi:hypothetical protein
MDKELFLQWLLAKRRLTLKAARDVVSRCKRIESFLDQMLEDVTVSQAAFNAALTGLRKAYPQRNDLLYAIRLYAGFRNPQLDSRRYAFYGDFERMPRPKNVVAGA